MRIVSITIENQLQNLLNDKIIRLPLQPPTKKRIYTTGIRHLGTWLWCNIFLMLYQWSHSSVRQWCTNSLWLDWIHLTSIMNDCADLIEAIDTEAVGYWWWWWWRPSYYLEHCSSSYFSMRLCHRKSMTNIMVGIH